MIRFFALDRFNGSTFKSSRTGTGSITKLDVDETIIDTDTIEEDDWTPIKGVLPQELCAISV